MTHQECVELLEHHEVKPTANRITIAETIRAARRPLSLRELEDKLLYIDKSVISRTLTLFREHHLVHVIDDGGSGIRYELCHSHGHDTDDDLHVHFFCERCQRTYCLEDIAVPAVPVPQGFHPQSASYIIKGICPDCD